MPWADSHCHLHDERVDAEQAVPVARAAGVARMVTVGCDEATSLAAIRCAARFDDVWATAGLHPHDAVDGLDWVQALLDDPAARRVVGVGECGLDYFYEHSPREAQRAVFAEQIHLAHDHGLPLVVHTRDAWDETFAILAAEGTPDSTIFHCFSGGPAEAERCLALHDGVFLSFSGIVTFKTATALREAAGITPLDRLLVETDSPYLAPVPHRGRSNQPAFVPLVGAAIAVAKGLEVGEVEAATWSATARAFGLPTRVPHGLPNGVTHGLPHGAATSA